MYIHHHNRNEAKVTIVAEQNEGVVKFGVARCGEKDTFCKKKGVLIARQRLISNRPYAQLEVPEGTTKRTLLENITKMFGAIVSNVLSFPETVNNRKYRELKGDPHHKRSSYNGPVISKIIAPKDEDQTSKSDEPSISTQEVGE